MCLIINKPADTEFTAHELRDFWVRNSDGVGIMWHNGESVDVEKITSPTVHEWLDFYAEHARGRACVIHLRMRTHGFINEENTHPYYIGRGYFLMHNGVLSSGNDADKSKSDTWHFIRDVLRAELRRDRRCFEKQAFIDRLGNAIGRGNKFVILGPTGRVITVNRDAGVVWKNAWFSNTYAWTAALNVHRAAAVAPQRAPVKRAPAKPAPAKPAPAPMMHRGYRVNPAAHNAPRLGPTARPAMSSYVRTMSELARTYQLELIDNSEV